MKRWFCLLMVLTLFASLVCGAVAEAAEDTDPAHQIEMKTYPFFLSSSDKIWKEDSVKTTDTRKAGLKGIAKKPAKREPKEGERLPS